MINLETSAMIKNDVSFSRHKAYFLNYSNENNMNAPKILYFCVVRTRNHDKNE